MATTNPVWEQKYREMPADELRAVVGRWREIARKADQLAADFPDEDAQNHARHCREALAHARRVARARGIATYR